MSTLKRLKVRNYRSLADVSVDLGPVNVLFGPNGSGKSSLLDTIWFFRDCAIRGVGEASSDRSHGIGILWDGAEEGEGLSLSLSTSDVEYEVSLGLSSGRIEPFAGERLHSTSRDITLISRDPGSDKATFYNSAMRQHAPFVLREPAKLSLSRYADFDSQSRDAADLDRVLHFVRLYSTRSFFLYRLKQQGSVSSYETRLWERGDNAWSVLLNLLGREKVDKRYDTIMQYMTRSFRAFDGLVLDTTGASSVYANFLEKGRREAIRASGASDGHLQMLLLLTALFAEGDRETVLLFDEPEISLHPWALAVLAEAVKFAAEQWNKQVLIATHSPVLISQFEPDQILAMDIRDGRALPRRLNDVPEIQDLLKEYGAGSLYMAEVVGAQSGPVAEEVAK
jgi:predicted ATPase